MTEALAPVVAPRRRVRTWRRGVTAWAAVVLVAALAVGGVTIGWAASMVTGSSAVAAGRTVTATCDPAPAWTWTFAKDAAGKVAAVTVGGVAATCAGGAVAVSLGDGSGTPTVGSADLVCTTTCSATVPFTSGLRYPSRITSVRAVVSAP